MSARGSVSGLLVNAKEGDLNAFALLHDRLRETIVARARKRLNVAPLRHIGSEDVAQQVFAQFATDLRTDRLLKITNRDELTAFLTTIAIRRAINEIKRETADKRDARRNVHSDQLEYLVANSNSPEQEVIAADCLDFYLNRLPEQLRVVAEMHLAGFEKQEIAEKIDRNVRAVERKLKLLREEWHELVADSIDRDTAELFSGHPRKD